MAVRKFSVILAGLIFTFASAQANDQFHWKCEQDLRQSGGAFESVSLEKNQSLRKLVFNYIPPAGSNLPSIENLVLVEDLHCRFYSVREIVQCVSTNFKRYLESKFETTENSNQNRLSVIIQSDKLIWPSQYNGLKTNGSEEFTVDLNSSPAHCGY